MDINQQLAIVDRVTAHLLAQNAKALTLHHEGENACSYRAPGGLKCGIGCLITDAAYDSVIENLTVDDNKVLAALRRSGTIDDNFTRDDVSLLCWLQNTHDRLVVSDWPAALNEIREDVIAGEYQ